MRQIAEMTPAISLFGTTFQNPVLLAAGTCGFGQELDDVIDIDRMGGIVTKSVTLEPRAGNAAPRVAEIDGGMLNSVGLANPGVERVAAEKLPWLAERLDRARVIVSVAGHNQEEYVRIVERLDSVEGFVGFELNLSCPNDQRLGGEPFSLDVEATRAVVADVRSRTERPLLVKLAPHTPDLPATAAIAVSEGADGITLINTMPGLALDDRMGAPRLGAGAGGLSGPALLAVGVAAVRRVTERVDVPVIGVGGIRTVEDARQYLRAGAALVQIGTMTFADPRASVRIASELSR